jgi:hypothetical protein
MAGDLETDFEVSLVEKSTKEPTTAGSLSKITAFKPFVPTVTPVFKPDV